MKLSEIAKIIKGELENGKNADIRGVAKIEEGQTGDITFLSNLIYKKYLITTGATAVLVQKESHFPELEQRTAPIYVVRVKDPYLAFLQLIDIFHPRPILIPKGIHSTAVISSTAVIGSDVAIGPLVAIGERCKIGNGTTIFPGTILSDDVEIGEQTLIYANVTVREMCKIGNRVIIHSGTVIGSDGFGFAPESNGTYKKIPQRGSVVIEDDVEIGANCSIDRATIGQTKIKRGAKLDNLIQIAHNVIIDENTVIAAQSGVSGSTQIGKNCIIAGQVGFAGHIKIADRTTFGAQSGIAKSITTPGKTYFGYPAKEHNRAFRIEAVIRQLPELLNEIRQLQKQIELLEEKLRNPIKK